MSTPSDYDLERLEASLRWLQRQEKVTRLARSEPPMPRIAPFEVPETGYVNEPADLRSSLSLEPERLAPPPESQRRWHVPAAVTLGCAVAAAIGYYVSAGSWFFSPSLPPPQLQAEAPGGVVIASMPEREFEARLIEARIDDHPTTAQHEASTAPQASEPPPARSAEPEAAAAVAASHPGALANDSRPEKSIRALEAGEVELLVRQAQQFVATGDLVTARTLFQRAAQAGDAAAAVALGATYDPVVLTKLGVVGINPDVEKARNWYRTAESLGSTEASQRLAIIAGR
jgi:hypothetical protein